MTRLLVVEDTSKMDSSVEEEEDDDDEDDAPEGHRFNWTILPSILMGADTIGSFK